MCKRVVLSIWALLLGTLSCCESAFADVQASANSLVDFPIEQMPSALYYTGFVPESSLLLKKGDSDYEALRKFLFDERHDWQNSETNGHDKWVLQHDHIYHAAIASQNVMIDCVDTVGFTNIPLYSVEIYYGSPQSRHIIKHTKGPCPLPGGFAASLDEEKPLGVSEFPMKVLPKTLNVFDGNSNGRAKATIEEGDKSYEALRSFLIAERDGWIFNPSWYVIQRHDDFGAHLIYKAENIEIICISAEEQNEPPYFEINANYRDNGQRVVHIAKDR